jgi:hypothetical protein
MTKPIKGHCLCGAVRFEVAGAIRAVVHCHCGSCRRATSSPITTFVIVDRAGLLLTAARPKVHRSSKGVRRSFCGTCGSPIAYETDCRPADVDLYACAFEDPAAFTPESHYHAAERVPWLVLADDLPHHGPGG